MFKNISKISQACLCEKSFVISLKCKGTGKPAFSLEIQRKPDFWMASSLTRGFPLKSQVKHPEGL